MSKKSHRSHIAQVKSPTRNPQGASVSNSANGHDTDATIVTEIRDTLQESLTSGVEAIKDVAISAQGAARAAAEKAGTMAHDAQETIVEAGHTVVATAKKNPVPFALVGLGAACAGVGVTMMMRNARAETRTPAKSADRGRANGTSRSDGNGAGKAPPSDSGLQRAIGAVTGEANKLAHQAQSSIEGATRAAGKAVGSVVRDAKAQGQRAGSALKETYESNPLAIGAAVVATGTILGLALPSTKREDTWLGEGRDEVVSKAKELVSGAIDKVDHIIHPAT